MNPGLILLSQWIFWRHAPRGMKCQVTLSFVRTAEDIDDIEQIEDTLLNVDVAPTENPKTAFSLTWVCLAFGRWTLVQVWQSV